jgi:hypothetical protein
VNGRQIPWRENPLTAAGLGVRVVHFRRGSCRLNRFNPVFPTV